MADSDLLRHNYKKDGFENQTLTRDFVHALYVITGVFNPPVSAEVASALKTFVNEFAWIYTSHDLNQLMDEGLAVETQGDVFVSVLEMHERDLVLQQTIPFAPELIIDEYLTHTNPKHVWGPKFWHLLHALAKSRTAISVQTVLQVLPLLLPCQGDCATSLSAWLVQNPMSPSTLSSPLMGAAEQYVVNLHNNVNQKLNKAVFVWDRLTD
jgi:hypothetical protein